MYKKNVAIPGFLTVLLYLFKLATTHNIFSEYHLDSSDFLLEVRDKENNQKCFGTLVSSNIILTSASCVEE